MSAAALRHAIAVYRNTVLTGNHRQGPDLHLAVANDAEHVLARTTGAPLPAHPPTAHCKRTIREALGEVYAELAVCCYSMPDCTSPLAARKKAAELLGIDYREFLKVRRAAA